MAGFSGIQRCSEIVEGNGGSNPMMAMVTLLSVTMLCVGPTNRKPGG
jgi:hypothetical protein